MNIRSRTRNVRAGNPIPTGIARRRLGLALAVTGLALSALRAQEPGPVGATLARQLSGEGQHAAAALEYRRLALDALEGPARAGWLWAAAFEYLQDGQWRLASDLLDRVENAARELRGPALLLRADAAAAGGELEEALYYYQSAAGPDPAPDLDRYVRRRSAEAHLHAGRPAEAGPILAGAPGDQEAALAALDRYLRGRDKRPLLGGALGLIPGLGYLYAGEYANGARSLILNGLFLGAMAYSAVEDQWGAFAGLSFFELTWYSGSIYGGLDAAHRYNRRRLEACLDAVRGGASFGFSPERLPVVSLQFAF